MLNWGYSISGGVGDTNLNTSHVNVKSDKPNIWEIESLNLNTSQVNVKFFLLFKANSAPSNLNTSHVNVK